MREVDRIVDESGVDKCCNLEKVGSNLLPIILLLSESLKSSMLCANDTIYNLML
jgi:hypothetical protein